MLSCLLAAARVLGLRPGRAISRACRAPRAAAPGLACALLAVVWSGRIGRTSEPDPGPPAAGEPATLEVRATDTIVVTATRRATPLADVPIAIEVIGREEIEASQARTAAEAVDRALGVLVTSSFRGDGLEVQGLEARHVLVLLDGERVTGKVGEQLDLSRFPAESIARIEIVKGAGSALYGSDAIGGVINIVTKKAKKKPEAGLELVYGEDHRAEVVAHGAARGDDVGLAGSFAFRRQDPYRLDPTSPATTASGFEDLASMLRLDVRLGALRLDARAQHLYREQVALDATALPPDLDGNPRWRLIDRSERMHTLQGRLGGELALDLHRLTLAVSTSLSWTWLIEDQRGGTQYDRRQPTTETLVTPSAQWVAALGAHTLTSGVELHLEHLDSARLDGGEPDRTRFAVYTQDEWQLLDPRDAADGAGPLLALVPGVRLDVDSQFGAAVTPRIAARFDPFAELSVRASFGLGFRAPGFRELYLVFENPGVGYRVEGNPDLAPERSRSLELSCEARPVDAFSANLTLFRHDLDDLIVTLPPVSRPGQLDLYGYANIAKAVSQGLELRLVAKPLSALRLEAGYAFTDSRDGDGVRIAGRATHQLNAQAAWRPRLDPARRLELSVRALVLGPRPFDRNTGAGLERVEVPWQGLADLRASVDLEAHLALFAGVDNVFAAGDAELHPIRPRHLYVGLEGRY